ncbi:MAG: MBL fold metallo-hydrolase [Burkholderiaceae bacterium]
MKSQVRRERLLHGWRDPVEPRPASTVILLRDGERGLEILMTRRSMQASFAPGAYVFPGGRVDDADHAFAARLGLDAGNALDHAFKIAAIREAFEELGVLFVSEPGGRCADDATIASLDRDAEFAGQLAERGLSPMLDRIHWFSHWITDRDLPKRFDTRFYVAAMPEGQTPVADDAEQFAPEWVNPSRALERHAQGQFEMIFPTIRTLRQLERFGSVQDLLNEVASAETRWRSCPRGGYRDGRVQRFSENESQFGELELVTPDGKVHHDLTWRHEPVRLLEHVWRITAPNPGRMTGPGTNTYVIGAPGNFLVLDPGPAIDEHIARIADLVGDGLQTIVCTHSHPDHYPGAKPLRERLNKPALPILGRPSGPNFNPEWKFEPDRTLVDGERLLVAGDTLRVLHTPGHASNHICLLLEADGLLFSGDHILNGSTTVIDAPDGDMKDYIDSLHRLANEPIAFILPAHGHVLGSPQDEIQRLIRHRLGREAKVLSAVRAGSTGTLDDLVLIAYDDVDPILHGVARRSLAAHLKKLTIDGLIREKQGVWAPV